MMLPNCGWIGQPALDIDRVLEILSCGRGRRADLSRGDLLALLLDALITSAGVSPRAYSFCGSSQIRIEYCPTPNTPTLPTPGTRESSGTSLIVA